MRKIETTLAYERSTKGTHVFSNEDVDAEVTTLYVQKTPDELAKQKGTTLETLSAGTTAKLTIEIA